MPVQTMLLSHLTKKAVFASRDTLSLLCTPARPTSELSFLLQPVLHPQVAHQDYQTQEQQVQRLVELQLEEYRLLYLPLGVVQVLILHLALDPVQSRQHLLPHLPFTSPVQHPLPLHQLDQLIHRLDSQMVQLDHKMVQLDLQLGLQLDHLVIHQVLHLDLLQVLVVLLVERALVV